jgi:4-amino-4-deoxy-L-arabinose transferase-like glycosyltransferase
MPFGLLNLLILVASLGVIGAVILDRLVIVRGQPSVKRSASEPAAFASARSGHVSGSSTRLAGALRRNRVEAAVMLLAGAAFLVIGQRGLLAGEVRIAAYISWFIGLVIIAALHWEAAQLSLPETTKTPAGSAARLRFRWQPSFLVAIVVMSILIWNAAPDRPSDDSSLDLVILWLLSIATLVMAATGPPTRQTVTSIRRWISREQSEIVLAAGVALVAAAPRLFDLNNYAWSMSGDEGTFAVTARNTLNGQLTNPFSSGPWGYPSMLFIIQGWFIDLFGDSVASARMLSALLGIGSVLAVYALVRHHFGLPTALVAALITATFNLHIYWSRDAQDAAAPMAFIPLALLFLDRGLIGGCRLDCVLAGLTIAFAQFFHPANRLLIPMAILYVIYALVLRAWQSREISAERVKSTFINAAWIAAATIVGHLPLIAYYWHHRTEFWSRTDEVSVFASGWLEREREITGDGSIEILLRQFKNAAMLPFSTLPHGHYRPGSPLAGEPLVLFVAIGCALVTIFFLRRRNFGIALAFWATTVGLALTDGPPMTNRYTAAAPFLAIFGAIGIVALAHILIRLVKAPSRPVIAVATIVTVLIAVWHLHFYFKDPNQVDLYSDANSQLANGIAREAEALGSGATVYLSGVPRLYYYGFQNIPYIAPDAQGTDVNTPWIGTDQPPELGGPTLFVFTPERQGELAVIQSWFPEGTTTEHFLPSGEYLYTSYLVNSPAEPTR